MELEADSNQYLQILRRYWLPLSLGVLGLMFFAYGLISFLGTSQKQDVVPFSQEKSASTSANLISVDIEGAVSNPGVYKLQQGSIIQDVLVLSNGLSKDADRDFVAKNINLAAKLSDGAKIYIPKVGESVNSASSSIIQVSNTTNQTGLININSASESQLDSLPGIGPVTAGKIISQRPYQTTSDLLSKKVVTEKVFSEIKDKITAY